MTLEETKIIEEIAKKHLFIETLETRNRDCLDFHEQSVASIKSALEAAFAAGQANGQLRSLNQLS